MDVPDLDVQGVDDLFDTENVLDDAAFDVPLVTEDVGLLPVQPVIPTGLVQYVAELRNCGSIQRIAWSRQGYIATLSPDSLRVYIQCLKFNRDDGSWALSEQNLVNAEDFAHPVTHLQWSPAGVDLTVVDSAGRLSIFTMSMMSVNRMTEVRPGSLDVADASNQAVAIFWLNQDRPVCKQSCFPRLS